MSSLARLFVLLGHDPTVGYAAAPVAVLAVDGDTSYISWLPYSDDVAREAWQHRIALASRSVPAAVFAWVENADGIGYDVVEVAAPDAADLQGRAEIAVDELLAAGEI